MVGTVDAGSLLGGHKSVIGFSIGLVSRTRPDLVTRRRTELWDLLAAGRLNPKSVSLPLEENTKANDLVATPDLEQPRPGRRAHPVTLRPNTVTASMEAAAITQVLSKRRPHMKQIQRARRHRRSAGGRQEPLAFDPRDPDIVYAHRIARRSGHSGVGRVRSGSHNPAAPIPRR